MMYEPETHGYMLNSARADQYNPGNKLYVGNNQFGARKDCYPENTSHARYIGYNLNGTGRDTYIWNDNGGFYSMKSPAEYKKSFEN